MDLNPERVAPSLALLQICRQWNASGPVWVRIGVSDPAVEPTETLRAWSAELVGLGVLWLLQDEMTPKVQRPRAHLGRYGVAMLSGLLPFRVEGGRLVFPDPIRGLMQRYPCTPEIIGSLALQHLWQASTAGIPMFEDPTPQGGWDDDVN